MIAGTPSSTQPLILELLVRRGVVEPRKLDIIRDHRAAAGAPLEAVIVDKGLASDLDVAQAYADYLALPLFDPKDEAVEVDPSLGRLLPEKLCRDQLLAPLAVHGQTLELAFVTPYQMLVIDEIQLLTGMTVRPMLARRSVVEALIDTLYSSDGGARQFTAPTEQFQEVEESEDGQSDWDHGDEVLHLDQPAPPGRDGRVVRLVNQMLEQALRAGASDVHLEPFEDGCKVRLRVDGVLHDLTPAPTRALFVPVVSRFKILAKMDIAEKRVPQDGAIALRSGDKRVDLRVSTIPCVHGEKMVLRLLDKGTIPSELTALGMEERQARDLIESIASPNGLVLVTGPTGSGKSTTLYACLQHLNEPDTNICTVEDPVEYKFRGINQVQVKPQVGLTFATALRAFLRQDPDVIMVGEVRDPETAQICLRAALTGHLVLSTIHTNDALSAATRLQDMGTEPFLVAATLRVLEAQRLIRRICQHCKRPYECDLRTASQHGLQPGQQLFRAVGCDACRGTGYRGRIGIFEVVRINEELANLIQARTPLQGLREAARAQGMMTLEESALAKACAGMTSLEEALGITMPLQD